MAGTSPTAKPRSGETIVDRMRKLGVRGVLLRMAECRQIIELQCEMPNCYCPNGRTHFDTKTHPPGPWDPSADHYPKLRSDGGQLVAWNVRLSHVRCNQEDYVWRGRIRRMLEQGMSLDEIAQKLNDKAIHAPHGGGGWSAATVRKAFVS